MTEPLFTDANNLPWSEDARFPGIALKVLAGRATTPASSVALLRVDGGVKIPPHTHPTETEIAYVLDGEGVFLANGQVSPLHPGTSVTIPPGLEHAVENRSDHPLFLIATHTPPTR